MTELVNLFTEKRKRQKDYHRPVTDILDAVGREIAPYKDQLLSLLPAGGHGIYLPKPQINKFYGFIGNPLTFRLVDYDSEVGLMAAPPGTGVCLGCLKENLGGAAVNLLVGTKTYTVDEMKATALDYEEDRLLPPELERELRAEAKSLIPEVLSVLPVGGHGDFLVHPVNQVAVLRFEEYDPLTFEWMLKSAVDNGDKVVKFVTLTHPMVEETCIGCMRDYSRLWGAAMRIAATRRLYWGGSKKDKKLFIDKYDEELFYAYEYGVFDTRAECRRDDFPVNHNKYL